MLVGAINTLEKHGVKSENIIVGRVPGSFELTFRQKIGRKQGFKCCNYTWMCSKVLHRILITFVLQGTPRDRTQSYVWYSIHFRAINYRYYGQSETVARKVAYGNKGDEAAITAIKMIDFFLQVNKLIVPLQRNSKIMQRGSYQSGQMGLTVTQLTCRSSVVSNHHCPQKLRK